MIKFTLNNTATLDGYIIANELMKRLGFSKAAYKYWDCLCAQYANCSTVYIARDSVPQKYLKDAYLCADLSGLISAAAFCQLTGIAPSHLNPTNNSRLFAALRIVRICGVKFVDLASLYARLEIPKNAHIYIEKCLHFAPSPFEKKIRLTSTLCLGYY